MKEVEIPRYIDSQPQIFFWELDEFLLSFGMVAVGIITDSLLLTLFCIWLVTKLFRRLKSRSLDGALKHFFYWSGALPLNSEAPDSIRNRNRWV